MFRCTCVFYCHRKRTLAVNNNNSKHTQKKALATLLTGGEGDGHIEERVVYYWDETDAWMRACISLPLSIHSITWKERSGTAVPLFSPSTVRELRIYSSCRMNAFCHVILTSLLASSLHTCTHTHAYKIIILASAKLRLLVSWITISSLNLFVRYRNKKSIAYDQAISCNDIYMHIKIAVCPSTQLKRSDLHTNVRI